ncbi:hypothetical protein J6590_080136 [Homalodisca vitripennis]|nr:hypothetical protein J6590_080136 [Homalodisca vitripennis]
MGSQTHYPRSEEEVKYNVLKILDVFLQTEFSDEIHAYIARQPFKNRIERKQNGRMSGVSGLSSEIRPQGVLRVVYEVRFYFYAVSRPSGDERRAADRRRRLADSGPSVATATPRPTASGGYMRPAE